MTVNEVKADQELHSALDCGQAILMRVELLRHALAGNPECEAELVRISGLVQEQAILIRRARSALGVRKRLAPPFEGDEGKLRAGLPKVKSPIDR